MTIADSETLDSILGGRIALIQPRAGYRFSVDAVLLGRFVNPRREARVLELGAGCGVISMMIATLYKPREVVALEIAPRLAKLVARNAHLNGLHNVRSVNGDLRLRKIAGLEPASFDWVIANPPYRATGRQSPNLERRSARHETEARLGDFVAAAARYVRHGGRVAMVMWAARAAELISELRAKRLEPKRIRMVHPRVELPATTILVEARMGGGVELKFEPPLVMYQGEGVYSEAAREWLGTSLSEGL